MCYPRWLGTLNDYATEASMKGATIKGRKSSDFSAKIMNFTPNKADHFLDVARFAYQYKGVQTADFTWRQFLSPADSCASTHKLEIKAVKGTKIGEAPVEITVLIEPGIHGQQQLITNEDGKHVESPPGAKAIREAPGEI